MKTRTLLIIGVLVFVYTLVVHAPLAPLYGHFKPQAGAVELVGVSGSLGAGSAAGVVVRGQTALRDLHWQFKPLQLLLGRAAFRLLGNGDGLLVDGDAALQANGSLRFDDFRASGPVKSVLAATPLFLPVDGSLGLQLDHLVLRDGLPATAKGSLALNGLAWKLGRDPMLLGDFEAAVTPDADGLTATIRSLRGPLEASGDAHLKADRSYDLHLQIRPKADAPPPLVNLLRSLGPPDTQAYYHLRRRGTLATAVAQEAPE
jgi:hypothetical protein